MTKFLKSFLSAVVLTMMTMELSAFVVVRTPVVDSRRLSPPVPSSQSTKRFIHEYRSSSMIASFHSLQMATPENSSTTGEKKPFWFDPNTKGGALVLMVVLFVVPLLAYNALTIVGGVDEIEAGIDIGIGFTVVSCFAWVSTYVFRVATKDMTYVRFSNCWFAWCIYICWCVVWFYIDCWLIYICTLVL